MIASATTSPRALKCPHCGGESDFDPHALNPRCGFCGSPVVLESGNTKFTIDLIAPLAVSESAARTVVELWIETPHEDVPVAMAVRAKLAKLEVSYWPFYAMSGVFSGWRGTGTITGGFSEMVAASGELFGMKQDAPLFRFYTPPTRDISAADLSERILNEMSEERRGLAHLDFCRNVGRSIAVSPLVPFTEDLASETTLRPFSLPYEAAETRLKEIVAARSKVNDIYFQQLQTKRVYWPFWVGEYLYNDLRYRVFLDGSSQRADYIGGYKPLAPGKANLQLDKLAESDVDDMIKVWTISSQALAGEAPTQTMLKMAREVESFGSNPKLEIKTGCFIATAAYGSEFAPELDTLRAFRDRVLLNSRIGRAFVRSYCRISPPIARLIARSAFTRAVVRSLLRPLIRFANR